MFRTKMIVLLSLVCLFLLAGCGNDAKLDENNVPDISDLVGESNSPPAEFSAESGSIQFGGNAEWPDYIPADIPKLEGQISTVMVAPESHVRIFYENITEDQIEDYLVELQAAGFQLEYLVYTREGFPDNSEERIQKGEYDAVDIRKGEYHMRLESGGNRATYDIYTSGFEAEAITATTPQWPEELSGLIPPPERCELTSVDQSRRDGSGYTIVCEPEDDQVFGDYAEALTALGFYKDPSIVSVNERENLWLTNGETSVQMMYSLTSDLMLKIEKQQGNAAPALDWPQDLVGLVPPPERCEITSIFPSQAFLMECTPADENVVQDYIDVLQGLGFELDNVFEGMNGEFRSVSLIKGTTKVEILPGSAKNIMVRISQGNP